MQEYYMFSSVTHSCPTLQPHESQHARAPCPSPTPEFTQTHVLQVGDANQPSHPRLSPFPPAPNPSQHQGLSNEYSGLISFRMDGLISLQSKGPSRVFSNNTVQKHQFFGAQLSL